MTIEIFIRICPKCGSTNIISFTGRSHIKGEEEFKTYCKECNYKGIIPEIDESEVENFRKELKKKIK